MNLTELLTRRLGPLPTWAYLVGVAGLGFLAYRMGWFGLGQGQPSAQPAPAQPALTPLQEAGLLQQLGQLQQQQAPAPVPVAPAAPAAPAGPRVKAGNYLNTGSIYLYDSTAQRVANVPAGTILNVTGQGTSVKGIGLLPVDYLGSGYYVSAGDVTPAGQGGEDGVGGPRAPRPHRQALVGGRPRLGATESMWRPGHPLLRSGDQLHPHFALGGPGTVMHAAAATGLHPARLLALNPHLRAGRARGNQYLRVR